MKKGVVLQKTKGDVFKIYITPPSTSFPWIRVFLHEYGIKKSGREVGGINAIKKLNREHIALEIGNKIIDNSHILQEWFKNK